MDATPLSYPLLPSPPADITLGHHTVSDFTSKENAPWLRRRRTKSGWKTAPGEGCLKGREAPEHLDKTRLNPSERRPLGSLRTKIVYKDDSSLCTHYTGWSYRGRSLDYTDQTPPHNSWPSRLHTIGYDGF